MAAVFRLRAVVVRTAAKSVKEHSPGAGDLITVLVAQRHFVGEELTACGPKWRRLAAMVSLDQATGSSTAGEAIELVVGRPQDR